MDRRLGRPLPHQLPNPTRADPLAINLSSPASTTRELIRYYHQFPDAIPYQRARSHALLTRPPLPLQGARLACVRPAASVRSEPGSNSQVERIPSCDTTPGYSSAKAIPHRRNPILDERTSAHPPAPKGQGVICPDASPNPSRGQNHTQDSEADTHIIDNVTAA